MADDQEEQQNELLALQSIYPDELVVVDESHYQFTVKSTNYEQDESSGCRCVLSILLPSEYPAVAPEIEMLEEPDNCVPVEIEQLMESLQAEADGCVGMCSVFTIVSAAIEWLNSHSDQLCMRKEEERKRIAHEKEEAERKRFEGTRVTVENFMKWKEVFEAEMMQLQREKDKKLEQQKRGKLTGFELFTKDSSLIDSDIKFREDAGEDVAIDETLFQDMEDLDFKDDDELS